MQLVRRPTSNAQIREYLRDLHRANEAEGVPPGELFELSRHDNGDMDRLKFAKDSETSRKAALDNYPRREAGRDRCLEALYATNGGGLTGDEVEERTGMSHQTCSARMNELRDGGFITCKMIDGVRQTRTTRQGSQAEVMIPTQKAHDGRARRK